MPVIVIFWIASRAYKVPYNSNCKNWILLEMDYELALPNGSASHGGQLLGEQAPDIGRPATTPGQWQWILCQQYHHNLSHVSDLDSGQVWVNSGLSRWLGAWVPPAGPDSESESESESMTLTLQALSRLPLSLSALESEPYHTIVTSSRLPHSKVTTSRLPHSKMLS